MEASMEMTIANNNQIGLDRTNTYQQVSELLKNYFYIYHDYHTTGPFNPEDIFKQYIGCTIKDTIWIKKAEEANIKDHWCKVEFDTSNIEAANTDLQNEHPELYQFLIPKINTLIKAGKDVTEIACPHDVPPDAHEHLSAHCVIRALGIFVISMVLLVIAVHMIPFGCCLLPIAFCLCCDCCGCESKWIQSIMVVLGTSGWIIVPCIIASIIGFDGKNLYGYSDFVDDYLLIEKEEFQSFMIMYISWGVFSFIFSNGIYLTGMITESEKHLTNITTVMFRIIGVNFDINFATFSDLLEDDKYFVMAVLFIFPSLAASLPAVIIGFIAYARLEEKFVLRCSDDIVDTDLCFDESGYGCCEVISSHDSAHWWKFLGGLAANVLAMWAVIQIAGYLMVNAIPAASLFAKRNK